MDNLELFIRDVAVMDKCNSVYLGHNGKITTDISEQQLNSHFKAAIAAAAKMYDKPVLVTQTDTTHYGFVNHNMRRYRIEFIKANARTFTDDYPKPIQLNHDGGMFGGPAKVIGRVMSAVPVIYGQTQEERNDILVPSGHVTCYGVIPGRDDIEQVMDGRLLTVSIGASSTDVKCSICGNHPLNGGCDHVMGRKYDVEVDGKKTKMLAFVDFGKLYYKEYSYVNVPADSKAKTGRYELVSQTKDSMIGISEMLQKGYGHYEVNKEPSVSFFFGAQASVDGTTASITDAAGNPDILFYDFKSINDIFPMQMKESNSTDIKPGVAPDIKREDNEPGDVKEKGSTPTDSSSSKPNKEEQKEQEETMEDKYAVLHLVSSLLAAGNMDAAEAIKALTEADITIAGDNLTKESILQKLDEILSKMEKEDEEKSEKDRVLTTKARKNLASSTFCGPNRSWPVPDCQHVGTARSYLANPARTKNLSTSQKSSIMTCVNRKAKSLGCDKGDNSGELAFATSEDLLNSRIVQTALDEAITEKEQYIAKLEDMLRKMVVDQVISYGSKLGRKWAISDEQAKTIERMDSRSIESLFDTLADLKVEANIGDDKDKRNNAALDAANNVTPDAGKETPVATPVTDSKTESKTEGKPTEEVTNPGQRKDKSILAKVLK